MDGDVAIRALFALMLFGAAAPVVAQTADVAADGGAAVERQCIDLRAIKSSRMTKDGFYEVRVGKDWWRNTANCPAFAPQRAIRTQLITTRLCPGDIALVFQPRAQITYGGCSLGSWEKLVQVDGDPAL